MIIGSCFWIHKKIYVLLFYFYCYDEILQLINMKTTKSLEKNVYNWIQFDLNISKSKVFFSSSGKCKIIFSNFHGKDDCVIRHFIIIVCCCFFSVYRLSNHICIQKYPDFFFRGKTFRYWFILHAFDKLTFSIFMCIL